MTEKEKDDRHTDSICWLKVKGNPAEQTAPKRPSLANAICLF
jgi:hypothetical protein